MKDRQRKIVAVGFDKSNGRGVGIEVACTITTGGNAGVAIRQTKNRYLQIPDRMRKINHKSLCDGRHAPKVQDLSIVPVAVQR